MVLVGQFIAPALFAESTTKTARVYLSEVIKVNLQLLFFDRFLAIFFY